jgi:hypothetical protein
MNTHDVVLAAGGRGQVLGRPASGFPALSASMAPRPVDRSQPRAFRDA